MFLKLKKFILLFVFRLPLLQYTSTFSPKEKKNTEYQDKMHILCQYFHQKLCHSEEREVIRERENISRAERILYKPATLIFQYYFGEENEMCYFK